MDGEERREEDDEDDEGEDEVSAFFFDALSYADGDRRGPVSIRRHRKRRLTVTSPMPPSDPI